MHLANSTCGEFQGSIRSRVERNALLVARCMFACAQDKTLLKNDDARKYAKGLPEERFFAENMPRDDLFVDVAIINSTCPWRVRQRRNMC